MGSSGIRVLLVEDDAGDAGAIQKSLRDTADLQMEIVVAATLADARTIIPKFSWDMVLLDLGLPDSTGIATFRAMQELLPTVPIVVLTGVEDVLLVHEAVHEGAQDYLQKGELSAELLSRTVRHAIERQRTQRSLDEERGRLFAVLDALPMFVYLQSPDHTIPFANRTFRKLFGEVEGQSCYEVFHGRDKPCPECPPMRVQETGEPEISEWTSREGRTYGIYDQVFPGPNDTPLTLEVGLDITEQKRAQRELARSEARFRRLAENAPDVIYRYRIAPQPGFDYISPAVTQVSGYTPEEYYADPLLGVKVIHPDDRHLLEGLVHGRLPAKRTYEVRWVHKDGQIRWTEDHHSPLYDESGRLVAIEGVARDITEWKRSQQALEESEERYRLLFEHAGIGIGYYTSEGVLIGYNRVAAAHMGGSPEEFTGKTILELFGDEKGPEYLQRVIDAARTAETTTYEDFAKLPTGPKWFLSTYSRVEGRDGEVAGVQVFSEEISDRKAAEEALVTERARLFAVLNTLPAFVYLQAADYTIPFANKRFVELFGDPKGRKCHQVLLGNDAPCQGCETFPVLEVGETIVRNWTTEAGRTHELTVQLFPVEGDEELILVIGMDVTDRRRAAEALQTADEIVSAIPSGILIYQYHEPNRLILVSGNPATEPFVNLGESLGKELDAHWPPAMVKRLKPPLLAIAVEGGVYDREVTVGVAESQHAFSMRAFRIPGDRVVVAFEDVTERRQAQEELRESEERFRRILESAPDIIYRYRISPPGFDYISPSATGISGYTPEEFYADPLLGMNVVHPEDRHYLKKLLQGRQVDSQEAHDLRCIHKNGHIIWTEDRHVPIYDGEKIVAIEGVARDITAWKIAQAELAESERRYRGIVELAPVGILTVDLEGIVTSCNEAFARMAGYDREELAGVHFTKLPPVKLADVPKYVRLFRSILIGRPPEPFETTWVRKNGTLREGEIRVAVMRRDDRLWGVQVTVEDITERKRLEESLRLTQYSIDSTEAVVLWVLSDGRLTYVNEAACRMLEYTREELLEMAVWDIDTEYPRTRRATAWEELKRMGGDVSESTFRTKGGKLFPVEITAQYLEFGGRELEFAVAFDITEKKRLEAQLRQGQRLESIGTLASGVAHEINNPLTGIINYAQLISDRISDAKLKGFADGIKEEGDRVAKIVRNLLSFSRQDREHSSPARIIDIVDASLSLYTALLHGDQIELVVDVPEELPQVECRSQEIQQVVINLLTNAQDSLNLRFPDTNEDKRIDIRARVLEEDDRKWVRLTVEDHGCGIPREIISRVFDPFFTTKPRDQGTGLGLSISYGLVRDHGGRMLVESVPNDVTRFLIDLPACAE